MKHVLVINFTDLTNDNRVKRNINFLKENYRVTALCLGAGFDADYRIIILKQSPLTFLKKIVIALLLLVRRYAWAQRILYPYQYVVKDLKPEQFHLILANDVETLPLAFALSKQHNCPVVFDAHEYAPRHFEDKWVWRFFFQPMNTYLCEKFLHQTAAMITIGRGLADEYKKHFQVNPIIITNANYFHSIRPSVTSSSRIRIVHHGIATPSRRLELMIKMMEHLDNRFSLDFYLLPSGMNAATLGYSEKLKTMAAKDNRIKILPPLKSDEIIAKINTYDIGVFLIPPVNFNYTNTLPNKLFDFIQARLAVAVGPTPEMAEIVRQYKLGVIAEDFTPEGMAAEIQKLTIEEINTYKMNADKAAFDLSAESNKVKLNALVAGVLHA